MRNQIILLPILFASSVLLSCSKSNDPQTMDCTANTKTVRVLTNKQATIKRTGYQYCIIEQGSIDNKLIPCYLAPAFQVHDLQVIISGEVKLTTAYPGEPCCSENFIITDIK